MSCDVCEVTESSCFKTLIEIIILRIGPGRLKDTRTEFVEI